jgi:uncharacterized SAM-binding protein YcdF (DUF218 family)
MTAPRLSRAAKKAAPALRFTWRTLGYGLLFSAVLSLVCLAMLRFWAGPFLFQCSIPGLRPPEMAYLLMGYPSIRPFRAAELYHDGTVGAIGVVRVAEPPAERLGVGPRTTDTALEILVSSGVPEDSLIVLTEGNGATSTQDEAVAIARHIRQGGFRSVTLITSGYHMRRSRWILNRRLEGTEVDIVPACVAHPTFEADDWWRTEDGLVPVFGELVKLVYYHVAYR